jgi:hypothetical protein
MSPFFFLLFDYRQNTYKNHFFQVLFFIPRSMVFVKLIGSFFRLEQAYLYFEVSFNLLLSKSFLTFYF